VSSQSRTDSPAAPDLRPCPALTADGDSGNRKGVIGARTRKRRQAMKKILLGALVAAAYVALMAGRQDIVRFRRMRRMSGGR
jgi:hypothetical protein